MSKEIVQHEAQLPAVASEATAMLQVIARAAADPTVDVDKLERLLAVQERIINKQAEADFNTAMTACQSEMRPIAADATNPQTRSKYATYAKLDGVLRPVYTKHGISISYSTEDTPKEDCIRVVAYVSRGGFTRMYRIDMPADGKGAKGGDVMTKTHAAGAAMSYASRYLLKAIFNVSVGEEDVDGNSGQSRDVPEEQKAKFREAMELVDTMEKWTALWQQITAATTAARDIATHEELRSEMAKKRKELK